MISGRWVGGEPSLSWWLVVGRSVEHLSVVQWSVVGGLVENLSVGC